MTERRFEVSENPITNLAAIDVVGARNDGGLDLVISCAGDLDSSQSTSEAIRSKVRNYLREAMEASSPTLRERFGCSADAKIRILILCPFLVHPRASATIQELSLECDQQGIDLLVDQSQRSH